MKSFVSMKYLLVSISLSLCVVSCGGDFGSSPERVSVGPYVLMVYPLTKNSIINGIEYNPIGVCIEVGCGDLLLINGFGDVNRISIDGMMDQRAAFSPDSQKVIYADSRGMGVIDNGHKEDINVSYSSPAVRYVSVDDEGDILYVNHQSLDDGDEEFDSLVFAREAGVDHSQKADFDGVIYGCNGDLYMFSLGEVNESQSALQYPEYIYNGKGKFGEIRHGGQVAREILGFSCREDGSFDYLALVEGDIVTGYYTSSSGFVDNDIKYEWDEFASAGEGEPIIVDDNSVWALNTLGEMRVFDRHSPNYRIAWDMYRYFEKETVSNISARAIQRDGSAFFFGIPKGKEKGWVMMEVGLQSGDIIRSVYLPALDDLYPKGRVQGIYMGDVNAFRKWADTQPVFDYSTMK